jgi:poly(hydroxyalkanoate) depolymerase family esterase
VALAGVRVGDVAAAAGVRQGFYFGKAGTLSYSLYAPGSYRIGTKTKMPLVVALHGCTESADQFRQLSRLDAIAAANGALVVYPDKSSFSDRTACWKWFQTAHMSRGSGEPALIAGVVKQLESRYPIDPKRVYVAGFSAGGAMASVMAATYPDVFAAAGIGSGCEYAAGPQCAFYRGIDPEQAGKQAYAAMGSHHRSVPVIVFQGDQDTIVPPVNSAQVVQQWQATNDLADNGRRDGSVPAAPTSTEQAAVAGGRSYTIARYGDAHGNELLQSWMVHGMPHAWSGGCGCQQYSDPSGPDAAAAMYAFFMNHPLRS